MKNFFAGLSSKNKEKGDAVDTQNLVGKIASSISTIFSLISSSNRDVALLKDRMSDISSQSVELSSTSEELERNTADIVSLVKDTRSSVEAMDEVSNQGKKEVNTMFEESKELAKYTQQSTEIIHDLNQDSEKIGNAVLIINAVAKQTNLLSLNAAIEAAKAAEHGKGFAVVAEEVRTLASRTAEASKTIRESIETMQSKVVDTLEKFEKIATMSNANLDLSQAIIQAFDALQEATGKVTNNTNKLDSAMHEQSLSITETARTVSLLNDDIQFQNDIIEEQLTKQFDQIITETEEANDISKDLMNNRQTIEVAIRDHLLWCNRIDNLLAKKTQLESDEELRDGSRCRFGQWYYNIEKDEVLKTPEQRAVFEEIEKPHQELHQLFYDIIVAHNTDQNTDEMKEQLDELSLRIVELMKKLSDLLE